MRHRRTRSRSRSRRGRAAFVPLTPFLLLAVGLATACAPVSVPVPEPPPVQDETPPAELAEPEDDPEEAPAEEPAEALEPEEERPEAPWHDRTLAGMTLRQKIGQMMMPWVLGDFPSEWSRSHDRVVRLIQEHGIGGVIMSVGSPLDVAVKLNDLQEHSDIPLLVAADLETGAGFRLRGAVYLPNIIDLGGATDFPAIMALGAAGDPQLAYEMGRITAEEARAVGIHVPFAPVLDVNSNPDNPIINVRSFGEDPRLVASLGAAFVRGIQDHGAVATGKHFPGHGDTETDSHLALPVIRVTRDRLDTLELVPFRSAIEAGMGAVMSAHISMPRITGDDGTPATLSRGALTGLLRQEMGFEGLIFTDAMDMHAIDRRFGRGEAAVRAVEAGADVILMPPSVEAAIRGIEAAVGSGRLSEARINDSVLRILEAKERLGLHEGALVDVREVIRTVGVPRSQEVAQEIADRSITLLKNDGDLLPLRGTRTANVLSVTYRRRADLMAGRHFNGVVRGTYPRLVTADVDRDTPSQVYDGLLRRARQSNLVVVSIYVTAVSYSGSVAIPREVSDFIQALAAARVPHVVVSFGNPYLLREFPNARAYMLAWSGTEVSQRAAARALFGQIEIRGRTPTRIPPLYEIGDGIHLPRRMADEG